MTVLRALAAAWLADRPHGAGRRGVRPAARRPRRAARRHRPAGATAARPSRTSASPALLGLRRRRRPADRGRRRGRGTIAYALDATVRRARQAVQRARTLRRRPAPPAAAPARPRPVRARRRGRARRRRAPGRRPGARRCAPRRRRRAARAAARRRRRSHNLADHCRRRCRRPGPRPRARLFGDLLAAGPGLVPVWEGLDQAGVVEPGCPSGPACASRPQRNAVHRHTVDRHLVETVVARRRPRARRGPARPAAARGPAARHRQGRRAPHDHSVAGAPLARPGSSPGWACPSRGRRAVEAAGARAPDPGRAGHPPRPRTTRRRSRPLVAAVGGSRELLELLRALTEADARAAGPAAWTRLAGPAPRRPRSPRARFDADRPAARPDRATAASTPDELDPSGRRRAWPVASRTWWSSPLGGLAPASTSSTATGSACSPTRPGCSPRTASTVRSALILRTVDGLAVDELAGRRRRSGEPPPTPHASPAGCSRLADGDRVAAATAWTGGTPRRAARRPRRAPWRAQIAGEARAVVVPGASERRHGARGAGAGPARAAARARPRSRRRRRRVRSAHIATLRRAGRSTRSTSPSPTARRCRRPGSEQRWVHCEACEAPSGRRRSGDAAARSRPSHLGDAHRPRAASDVAERCGQSLALGRVRHPLRPADRHLQEPARQGPAVRGRRQRARSARSAWRCSTPTSPCRSSRSSPTPCASGRSGPRSAAR